MPPLKPGTIWPVPEEEEEIRRGIALAPDNPELTDEDFARMRPAVEVVPEIVKAYREGKLTLPAQAQRRSPPSARWCWGKWGTFGFNGLLILTRGRTRR